MITRQRFITIDKQRLLKNEVARLRNIQKVTPIVTGAQGPMTTRIEKFIMEARIQLRVEHEQKTVSKEAA